MALQGTLRDFSLADIFQLIGLQKKTGVLTLKNGQEVMTVSFLDGNVVAADSLHRRLEDRLGTVLVKTKQISPAQLQEALKIQKQTLKRLGNVLVDQKFISQQALREALRIQITQIIYRLFRWRDGDYHFSQEEKLDYDGENVVPLSAESVLMEGARILDEWPMIEKRIGSLSNIYRRSAAAEDAVGCGGGEDLPDPERRGEGAAAAPGRKPVGAGDDREQHAERVRHLPRPLRARGPATGGEGGRGGDGRAGDPARQAADGRGGGPRRGRSRGTVDPRTSRGGLVPYGRMESAERSLAA